MGKQKVRVQDDTPYIEIKKNARIARSGKQVYTADEIALRGLIPKTKKPTYVEYRPPEVLIRNKNKFNHVFFVNDHAPEDVTPDNWKEYAVGTVGGSADVIVTDDGEIFITNDIIFYDRKAYDDYKSGKRELSAAYHTVTVAANDPETDGYDFILADIVAVDHVALCDRARAGRNARIIDSARASPQVGQFNWEAIMAKSMNTLAHLGIGKTAKDKDFSFAQVVLDSVAKVGTIDKPALEKEIDGVMGYVSAFADSETRDLLAGAVSDSFKNPVEVMAKRKDVGKLIDRLYEKCRDENKKKIKKVLDEEEDDKTEDEEEDDKTKDEEEDDKAKDETEEKSAKDHAALIDEAVAKALEKRLPGALKKTMDGFDIPALIDAGVRKHLNIEDPKRKTTVQDAETDRPVIDTSFIVADAFGVR